MPEPKIVAFDIEATNLDADFGYMVCGATKELGKTAKVSTIADFTLHDTEPWNDSELLKQFVGRLSEADVIVSYYGKGFDVPFVNARLLANRMAPIPETIPHLDMYYVARRVLKIQSRSMANIAELVDLDEKKTYVPRKTWIKAQTGHVPSINILAERCKGDVRVLEGAYLKLRGSIRLHPAVGRNLGDCRFCGATNLQSRGYQVTQTGRRRRVHCETCGAWDTRRINGNGSE